MSRTKNSLRNMAVGIVGQIFVVLIQFVSRSVFIDILGAKYLGLTGLFTNIISMLALSELGVGTAIMYKLYKPISENDERKIYVLMKFFKKVYQIIGIVVLGLGLLLLPFLKTLINDDVSSINIYFIFLLYLAQSVSSYFFFAYKTTLIDANQKSYITVGINYLFVVLSHILQIIFLIVFKNFTIYVAISIVTTIIMNFVISRICDKMYPFINKKSDEVLDKNERKEIFKDCSALVIYKANAVVLNATDNLILSSFIGLSIVGLYSNYLLIFTFINTVLTKFYTAITASLGNLNTSDDIEHKYNIFEVINFISFAIFVIASLGIIFVSSTFIEVWLGKEFLLGFDTVILLGIKMYIDGQKKVLSTYRTTLGLFQQAKYRPLAGAIINLVASIILVNIIGISGVILGTIIADLLTYMWFDPYIIYKHSFIRSPKPYYIRRLCYFVMFIMITAITYMLINLINVAGIIGIIINTLICIITPVIIISLFTYKTKEFKYILNLINQITKRYIK